MADTRYHVGDIVVVSDDAPRALFRGLRGEILNAWQDALGTDYYVRFEDGRKTTFRASQLRKGKKTDINLRDFKTLLKGGSSNGKV